MPRLTRHHRSPNFPPRPATGSEVSETQIRYVPHPDFDNPEAVHDIMEALPEFSDDGKQEKMSRLRGQEYLLPNRRLLTARSEKSLFLRMNLLKHMAARRQAMLHSSNGNVAVEQRQIERLLQDADQTRNEIIEANQRLVVSNANKFVRSGVPLSDLISEGNTALIKSVELFDAARGYRLSTYATHAIRRHLSRFVQREQRVSSAFAEEAAEPLVEEESAEWIDVHPGELANQILNDLPARERSIVRMRFGLTSDGRARTLDEIARRFGISKERVRQLIARACSQAFSRHGRRLGFA